jgi:hypothetical protein
MNKTTHLTATSETPPEMLFDEYGRRIPQQLANPANPTSRRYFRIEQPEIDYSTIFERTSRHLGNPSSLTPSQFEERAKAILDRLTHTPALTNLMRGTHVPFILPRYNHPDLGQALDDCHICAVGSAFTEAFPQYHFDNHNRTGLAKKLQVHSNSRHNQLIVKMQKEDVVGYYFPCLTEFSVPAAVEQITTLPPFILLAGGYDTCAALVGSPGLLQRREGYPNMLWLAAMQTEAEDVGYHFEAYGQNLTFNRRSHFGQVSEYWASGLVILG